MAHWCHRSKLQGQTCETLEGEIANPGLYNMIVIASCLWGDDIGRAILEGEGHPPLRKGTLGKSGLHEAPLASGLSRIFAAGALKMGCVGFSFSPLEPHGSSALLSSLKMVPNGLGLSLSGIVLDT